MGIMRANLKKIIMNNKIILLINVLLVLVLIAFIYSNPINNIRDYHVEKSQDIIGEYSIYDKQNIIQTFECNDDGINGIEIPVTTSYGKQYGVFSVTLTSEEGALIQQWTTEKRCISTDYGMSYRLDNNLVKGNRYNLIIEAKELDRPNALGVETEQNTVKADESISYIVCLYDEQVEDNHIAIALYTSKPNVFAYISIILIFVAVNYCWFRRDKVIESCSVLIMLILGFIMLMTIASSAGPDEDYHYYTSIMMSNVLLGHDNLAEVEKEYKYDYDTHLNTNNNFNREFDRLLDRGSIDDSRAAVNAGVRISKMLYPVSHIIPATGFTIGRLLKLNGVQVYMLARLFNLIGYIIMIQMALRILPKYKELLFVYAINPMAMQQATSLSYDALINGLSIVFVVIILAHIINNEQITWKDILLLTLLIVAFGPIKPVYIAHVLFVLVAPLSLFNNKKDKAIKILFIAATVAVVMIITSKATPFINGLCLPEVNKYQEMNTVVDSTIVEKIIYAPEKYSAIDVIKSPLKFAGIFIRSINKDFVIRFEEMFGFNPSYEIYTFEYVILIYVVALFMSLFNEEDEGNYFLSKRYKIATFIIALIEIALVVCAGFLMTNYGSNYIQGLQGRYFIPCVFILLFAIKSNKISIQASRFKVLMLVFITYLANIIALMSQIVY